MVAWGRARCFSVTEAPHNIEYLPPPPALEKEWAGYMVIW